MSSSWKHDSFGHQRSHMSLKGFNSWACASIGQMFSPSKMFSWHQSFSISAPWKKGKRTPPADSRVVLTNMKIISNDKNQSEGLRQDSPTTSDSATEPGPPESSAAPEHPASPTIVCDAPVKAECLTALPGLDTLMPKHQALRLAKFESEDSGVELPSGANSPSTPKGSEKSFVLHSRDPSCDSGVLSASSSPAADHAITRVCKDAVDACLCISDGKPAAGQSLAICLEDGTDSPEVGNAEQSFLGGSQAECLEEKISESLLPIKEEKRPGDDCGKDNFEEMLLQGYPLRKYPTSDSLDEYMDECCRLSKVNQGNAKAHGSGLGYLEHICQLIEKIGQLQEHNLRLQKQVGSLQKEQRANQLTEECFLQHCSCGAARILLSSYQEGKNFFPGKSRPHSLLVQNGNMSDLSIIPEVGGGSSDKTSKGRDVRLDPENNQLIMELQLSNGKKSGENESRDGYCATDGKTYLLKESAMKRGDNPAWGRMRDLLRKSRGRNQSRLGLSSAALKRSCPQLYRPDSACSDLRKTERNSMIALGQSSRNESFWPF
ncbi:uncharacterized protein LOC117046535 isoform X2 [Lacerta agilis]|uniref:uncharacterized protein LOC117046535 isoform X2 n=1 Tax=Lacerta agilis TaxID=80427 RepID=UPI001419FF9A|nr:uncharacterized protein LOC117046535 isoform X2 [Lacerta agilis]